MDFDVITNQNGLGCRKRPTSAEHGEPTQQLALPFRQELVTPV